MKKLNSLLVLLIFLFSGFKLFSESANVVFFDFEKPGISTELSLPIAFKRDLKVDFAGLESKAFVDFTELAFDAGLSIQNQRFDFTTNVNYMPLFLNMFQAGLGIGYHLYRYNGTFTENDILFSARVKWCRTNFFNWDFDGGIILKITDIDSMRSYRANIFNYSYFLGLNFIWHFTPEFDVYGSVKSYDYFDCPLLGTPFFKTGFNYEFAENMKINMDITFKFVDMITSAVYLSQCVYRTSVKVNF